MMIKKSIRMIGAAACALILTAGCSSASRLPDLSDMEEITVVSREEGSGTRAEFESLIDSSGTGTTVIAGSTDEVLEKIKDDLNAIGYAAYSAAADDSSVRIIAVNGTAPDNSTIRNNKYKLCRNYILAYDGNLSDVEADFLAYTMSAGQKQAASYAEPVKNDGTFLSDKSSGTVTIHGSTSAAPLIEMMADDYQTYNPNAVIEIEATDSSSGLTDVMQGKCSFAMSSRSLKDYENELLESTVIARDAIAVIVNPKNPVNDLSLGHLQRIYNNSADSWSDLN